MKQSIWLTCLLLLTLNINAQSNRNLQVQNSSGRNPNQHSVAATLSITSISGSVFCASDNMQVGFSATGTINAGNNYLLQLSGPSGSWSNPVTIGTIASTALSGTFTINLPKAVPSGTGYLLRVQATSPVTISPSSSALTINGVIGDVPNPALYKFIGEFGDRAYFFAPALQTWMNAETACQNNGGHLATIPDAATNQLITANSTVAGSHIGFTDQVTEGSFLWANAAPITYTNWNAGEPNNSGNEDYGMTSTTGFWNDINGTVQLSSFLQLNTVSSNSPACSGGPIWLFAPTVPGATYLWSGPNSFSSAQQNPVIANANSSMSGNYTVNITKGSCTISYSISMVVNPSPNGNGQSSPLPLSLSGGLVLHYPMDGNATDASGFNLHGTIVGGVSATSDRFGNPGSALLFNGTNGYIDAPDNVYFSGGNFTVSCWVKANTYGLWSRVFDFGNGSPNNNVLLAVSNGNSGRPASETFVNTISGGQFTSPSVQTGLNAWTSLIYTYENGTGKIYRNGIEIASGTQSAPQNVVRTLCYIGRSNWSSDSYTSASFDDFRIYNRAISGTEITALVMEQPEAINTIASPSVICPNTSGTIKLSASQLFVSYQLQNTSTSTNVGSAQNGNGDTLTFSTGNISTSTGFHIVATGPNGCSVIIGPVTANVITPTGVPTVTGASRCGPGSVILSASGAPVGAVYYWYVSAVGGTPVFIGPNYTTPSLFASTTYYVSIYANGCESNRTPVTATINIATAPAVDLNNDIIMRFRFDGNTADSSGRNNHATLISSATYTNDRFGQPNKAMSISSGNYLDCGTPADIAALTNQVSLSMWINQNYYAGGSVPLLNDWANNGLYSGTYGYWNAQNVQQNRVIFRVDGSTYIQSRSNIPFNQWTNIVCTFDGNMLKIYINGQLDTALNNPGGIGYTGAPTQIGRQANGSGSQTYNGQLDELYVYKRALNTDEVLALYFNNSVAFSNTPVCDGGTLQLFAPSIAGASYSWTGPNGFSSAQEDPAPITNASIAQAGTYSLVIVNPNGCTSPVQLNTVIINPLPAAAVTVNDTVCSSGNASLLASGGSSYLWYNSATGGSPVSGQTGPVFTINNLTATDTFYVEAVSASGCSSPVRTPAIAVYQNTIATNLSVNGSSICAGNSTATVTIQNSQTGVTYFAYYNNNPVSAGVSGNGSVITLTVNTASLQTGSNSISLLASQGSCGSASLLNTATIMIHPLPSATISSSGPLSFCTGDSVVLSAPSGMNYLWNTNSTSQSLAIYQSGTYSVTVTDGNGCSNSSAPVTINVLAPPLATITVTGNTILCQGNTVQLNASGGSSYLWSNGSVSSTITVSQTGSYSVIASNGYCTDTAAAIQVIVNPLPAVNFSMGTDTFFCTNSAAITIPAGSPSGGIYSGPGVSGNTFTPANAGTGFVAISYTYTDTNGCSATITDQVFVDVCTGTNLDENHSSIASVIPNPAAETAIISWPSNAAIEQLEILDAAGRIVLRENVSGANQSAISVSELADGIYFIRLSGKETLMLRMIKN